MTLTLTLTYDLDLQPTQAMVMTYSRAKVQGQRSVGSEHRVETNGRTDGRTYGRRRVNYSVPLTLMWSAMKYGCYKRDRRRYDAYLMFFELTDRAN